MVCVIMLGTFLIVKIHHYNPVWSFFIMISIIFLAGIREEYRKEFRSPKFVFFVLGWVVINVIVIILVLSFLR